MVKRHRTASLATLSESSNTPQSPAESSSAGPLTPSTAADEHHAAKIQHVDATSSTGGVKPAMRCFLPPHPPQEFDSYNDYETHYRKYHTNRCHECNKNFPSDHYLNLHIAENHDPINEVKRAKGEKTYACFVEGCDKVCVDSRKRRWHVIAKHEFPKNYDFFIVNDGIDKRNSMLRPSFTQRRRSSSAAQSSGGSGGSEAMEILRENAVASAKPPASKPATYHESVSKTTDIDIDSVTESMSALKFVPPSVRFGRGRGRGGLSRR